MDKKIKADIKNLMKMGIPEKMFLRKEISEEKPRSCIAVNPRLQHTTESQ